jgi:hypothetical protein
MITEGRDPDGAVRRQGAGWPEPLLTADAMVRRVPKVHERRGISGQPTITIGAGPECCRGAMPVHVMRGARIDMTLAPCATVVAGDPGSQMGP